VLRLQVPLWNRSPRPITSVTMGLSTRASDDEHAAELSVEHVIAAGGHSTETWDFDETATRGSRVAALLTHPERLTIRPRSVVTDNEGQADTLRLVRRYGELKGQGAGNG